MDKNLILIDFESNESKESKLYNTMYNALFTGFKYIFGDKHNKDGLTNDFGDPDYFIRQPKEFDPIIEQVFINIEHGYAHAFVVSFDINNQVKYAFIVYNTSKYRYELSFYHYDFNKINTKAYKDHCLDSSLCKKIFEKLKDFDFNFFTGLEGISGYDYRNNSLTIGKNFLKKESVDTLNMYLDNVVEDEYTLLAIDVDLLDFNNPQILQIYYLSKDHCYRLEPFNLTTQEVFSQVVYQNSPSFVDCFGDIACSYLKEENKQLIEEHQKKQLLQDAKDVLFEITTKYILKEREKDHYFYPELNDDDFAILDEEEITIKQSRDSNNNDTQHYEYLGFRSHLNELRNIFVKYLNTKSTQYLEFKQKYQQFLDNLADLDSFNERKRELFELAETIPAFDKDSKDFKSITDDIVKRANELQNIDKIKLSTVKGLLNKIKDEKSYEKYIDDLNNAVEELSDAERLFIQKEYDAFLDKFSSVAEYIGNDEGYRKVFVRPRVFEEILDLNSKNRELELLKAVDDLVVKLRTLPAKELGKFLASKGLNHPIKEDRTIKKIRIKNHEVYRLLFVYRSDIPGVALESQDDIYIFALTEHKKDSGDLYVKAKSKPTQFKLRDFRLYTINNTLKIPDITDEQRKVAHNYVDCPVVTFGCAGSGKTTVSIEQYVYIVYNEYDCVSPSREDLVYVTFHKKLSDHAKDELKEFQIIGNCYKLDQYFADVIGETYDQEKMINEGLFIKWFKEKYSEKKIQENKNKIHDKIKPLLSKPDIARLLYTYYRGVFKGSRLLFDKKENYLSLNDFLLEMNAEEYLSKEEKISIFNICLEFDNYIQENGLLSDNDYAYKVIRQRHYDIKKTKCIIIDEVQDLTQIELAAVICTLQDNSKRIYFYGDPHQSINPNIFFDTTIDQVYKEIGHDTLSTSAPLKITYRTNKFLIDYLNELLELRKSWIGLTGKHDLDKIEMPDEQDVESHWAGYVTNEKLYDKIFAANPTSIVITPSDEIKEKLINKKYHSLPEDRVITIYEAKGMEWDTVIMYDIFTSYQPYFDDMAEGRAKKSTIHRMAFNKYYVGCTRSTKSFIVIEENQNLFHEDNKIYQSLLSSFDNIYEDKQIDLYITENNNFDSWYREAFQNIGNDSDKTFKFALLRAQRLAITKEQQKLVSNLLNIDKDPKKLFEYGKSFLDEEEYGLALSTFIKVNKLTKNCPEYILLCRVIQGKEIEPKHIKVLLSHNELLEKYPLAYKQLIKQPGFKFELKDLYQKLFKKGV